MNDPMTPTPDTKSEREKLAALLMARDENDCRTPIPSHFMAMLYFAYPLNRGYTPPRAEVKL